MLFRFTLASLGLSLGFAASAEVAGYAGCVEYVEANGCELKWTFAAERDHEYRVQVWNPKARAWKNMSGRPQMEHDGWRLGTVAAGRIYRVLACDSKGGGCSSSNAVWAPVWDRPENIPDTVRAEGPEGPIVFEVTKFDHNGLPNTTSEIVTQYNMYLLNREAVCFFGSGADMPPMPMPQMKGEAPDTIEEMVAFNVQQNYEQIRSDVLGTRGSEE